jgi:hypothetical protein
MNTLAGDYTWRCMVCKRADRPFDAISVAYRPPPLEYAGVMPHINVSYCNDRPECVAVATAAGPWPLGANEAPADDAVTAALDAVWCAAVDASTSPDFDGDDVAREQYRIRAIAQARKRLGL